MSGRIIPSIPVMHTPSPASHEAAGHAPSSPQQAQAKPAGKPLVPGAGTGSRALGMSLAAKFRKASATGHMRDANERLLDLAVTGDPTLRSLAAAMIPAGVLADTVRQERELFNGFERPGFQDREASMEKASAFLMEAFGVKAFSEMAAVVATAAARVGSRQHALANKALELEVLSPGYRVGRSTIEAEKVFRLSVGF